MVWNETRIEQPENTCRRVPQVRAAFAAFPAKMPVEVFQFFERVRVIRQLAKREREAKKTTCRMAEKVENVQYAETARLELMKVC
jgi:hypothetical protein